MPNEIPTLLRDAAADPSYTPDFDALAARAHGQRVAARFGATTALLAALGVGALALLSGSQPSPGPVISEDTITTEQSEKAGPPTDTPGSRGNLAAGTLRVRSGDSSEWEVALTPGQLARTDVAYLKLRQDTIIACRDGTTLTQKDIQEGQRVTVVYEDIRLSKPPVLDADRLIVTCNP